MQYLLLGFAALLLVLFAMRGFTIANPNVMARGIRTSAGVAALVGAAVLLVRGLGGYAMSLAALGTWLLWGGGLPWGLSGPAQKSRPELAYRHRSPEVEPDHDTGASVPRAERLLLRPRSESLAPVRWRTSGRIAARRSAIGADPGDLSRSRTPILAGEHGAE
jgi:hypothetical protein